MKQMNNCSNKQACPCTATSCSNHGRCCDCVANHRTGPSLPACLRETFMLKPEQDRR